jgi:hypothetical protein
MKQAKTEQASSSSVKFKELRSRNTSEHNMGPAGYTVKLEQWEEEDRQLAAAGIPNPNDAYPDDHSKNWLRARSKLVIKDHVAVIVFTTKRQKNWLWTSRRRMHVQNLQEWQGRRSMMC